MTVARKRIITLMLSLLMVFSLLIGSSAEINAYAQELNVNTCSETGKSYYGFRLDSIKNEPGISSEVMTFTHIKTGARLMYIKNEDTQRVFDITFRTPASDNTGVNHIIEHSVLDGSKNYPVKSPFKEMLKSSLGSFINAMTSTDYTTFPVASTNEQDLENLMGVYLDAVFYPNLVDNDKVFKQEGWRYELSAKNSALSINGVVYNEMKGNYSDPQWLLNRAVNQSLFPDTSNRWDSGGNPDAIPTLTREKFIATYKKYYTPSNSYIYLYGKLDIAKYLKFIDEKYLSKFDSVKTDTLIKAQKPLSGLPEKIAVYPVTQGSSTKRKTYLSLNYVTGNVQDEETNTALGFLSYLLTGTDNAPLKKALMNTGLADNISSSFTMSGLQPVFSINAFNSDEASKKVFQVVVQRTLQDIVKNGFDKDFLKSALESYNISSHMEKLVTPILGGNGIVLLQTALSTWIYDMDPTMYFETDSAIKKIAEADENKYFQDLINKYLLSNDYNSLVILKPEAGLDSKNTAAAAKKLAAYKKSIGEKGISLLLKDTQAFSSWQKSEDSKEAAKTLPKLSLKDIDPELPDLNYTVENQAGINVLTHNADLSGMSSINLYFDTTRVPQDKLHYLNLLAALLGNVNTKTQSCDEISNDMLQYMGMPAVFVPSALPDSRDPDKYNPKMTASFIVPDNNISKSIDIVMDIINNTEFNDKQKIKQVISQNEAALQMIFSSGSGTAALLRANSYLSESGRYSDELTGYSYYKFLQDLDNNFDKKWDDISKNLKDTCSLVFNRDGLTASCSGDKQAVETFKKGMDLISSKIGSQVLPQQKYVFVQPDKNTAFSSTSEVQTIIQTGDIKKAGYTYSGKMMVLQNVLNMGYLWNKVRTTGGAYGVQSAFSTDGRVTLSSMSDPNLKETLAAFNGSADYLKNFNATDEEMSDYIIGAIRDYVNLKATGPLMEGALCDSMYLTNTTVEDLLKYEKEALSTTQQDIRNYGELLEKILDQNIYFVEGSKDKIEKDKQLFNQIIDYGK